MSNLNELNSLWRIWTIFDPRTALLGLSAFLLALALLIHFILLNSSRFNWVPSSQEHAAVLHFLPPVVK